MSNKKIEKIVKCDVLECKNTFVQKTRRNIYCSPKCRELARKRRVEQESKEDMAYFKNKKDVKIKKKFLVRGTIHNLSRGSVLGC